MTCLRLVTTSPPQLSDRWSAGDVLPLAQGQNRSSPNSNIEIRHCTWDDPGEPPEGLDSLPFGHASQ